MEAIFIAPHPRPFLLRGSIDTCDVFISAFLNEIEKISARDRRCRCAPTSFCDSMFFFARATEGRATSSCALSYVIRYFHGSNAEIKSRLAIELPSVSSRGKKMKLAKSPAVSRPAEESRVQESLEGAPAGVSRIHCLPTLDSSFFPSPS